MSLSLSLEESLAFGGFGEAAAEEFAVLPFPQPFFVVVAVPVEAPFSDRFMVAGAAAMGLDAAGDSMTTDGAVLVAVGDGGTEV